MGLVVQWRGRPLANLPLPPGYQVDGITDGNPAGRWRLTPDLPGRQPPGGELRWPVRDYGGLSVEIWGTGGRRFASCLPDH
jgi:hypothetical protein